MIRFLGEIGSGSKVLMYFKYTFLFLKARNTAMEPKTKRFSPTNIIFGRPLRLPKPLNAALLARKKSQMTISSSIFSTLAGRVKMLMKSFKLWKFESATVKTFQLLHSSLSRKNMLYQEKVISVKSCTCSVFSLTVSMQYTF